MRPGEYEVVYKRCRGHLLFRLGVQRLTVYPAVIMGQTQCLTQIISLHPLVTLGGSTIIIQILEILKLRFRKAVYQMNQ